MVVSNCQRGYIETFFQWSGLGTSFVDHECWGNTGCDKAENLRRVIARNGLRAPCFVGDTDGDRLAARANGVSFVHVDWGFGTVPECDLRVGRFEELVALVA